MEVYFCRDSLRLRLGVHKEREWNGMEWNDHKGMERNGMKWNVFKQEKGMEMNGME